MFYTIFAIHLILCLVLVALILLQEGKDIGSAFGAGGANTLFGAAGIDKPIVRATTIVALLFMVTSMILVNLYSRQSMGVSSAAPLPEELQRINKSVQMEAEAARAAKDAEKKTESAPPAPAPAPADANKNEPAAPK